MRYYNFLRIAKRVRRNGKVISEENGKDVGFISNGWFEKDFELVESAIIKNPDTFNGFKEYLQQKRLNCIKDKEAAEKEIEKIYAVFKALSEYERK